MEKGGKQKKRMDGKEKVTKKEIRGNGVKRKTGGRKMWMMKSRGMRKCDPVKEVGRSAQDNKKIVGCWNIHAAVK